MKCPYCNEEMVLGYVQSSRALVWDTSKLSGIIMPSGEGDGIQLTKSFSKAHAVEAHLCKKCQLLISKLNENIK